MALMVILTSAQFDSVAAPRAEIAPWDFRRWHKASLVFFLLLMGSGAPFASRASAAPIEKLLPGALLNVRENPRENSRENPINLRNGEVRIGGRAQALLRWQDVRALVDRQELSFEFVNTQLKSLQGDLPYYQVSLDARGERLLLSFPGLGVAVDESVFRREVARLKMAGVPLRAAGIRVDPADSTLVIWIEMQASRDLGVSSAVRPSSAAQLIQMRESNSSLRIAWPTRTLSSKAASTSKVGAKTSASAGQGELRSKE